MNNETKDYDDFFSALGGFIDELKTENENLKSSLKKWEDELSSIMPPDYKDWWQNSREEWPEIAKQTILSLRERELFAWDAVARLEEK